MDATRMLRFPRASGSIAAQSRKECQRYNPRMSASRAAALAGHVTAACCLGLFLGACGGSVAGLLGGQAPASSPSVDARRLTLTAAATPEPIPSPSPTASQTPPPPTPSISVPTPVNLLLESGTIAYAVRRDGRSTVFLLPLGSPDALPLPLASDDRDPAFNPHGSPLVY